MTEVGDVSISLLSFLFYSILSCIILQLVLLIGDMHIPQRAHGLPDKFKEILLPEKMRYVAATGNLSTKEQLMELRQLAPHVTAVRGEYDEVSNGASLRSPRSQFYIRLSLSLSLSLYVSTYNKTYRF